VPIVGRDQDGQGRGTEVGHVEVAHLNHILPDGRVLLDDASFRELLMMERDDEPAQLCYAAALSEWGDAGGYDAEVLWDACCVAALGVGYERCRWRSVTTLSGGEQKRLVLEALLRGPAEVLLLDEPDNYLDVPASDGLNSN
jgi:hypothetical protein